MLTAHLVRGAVVGGIAALVLTGSATIPLLALLGAIFGAADALYMPAQQAFLPANAGAGELPSGNALLQGTYQLASIVGPPVAGAVIAVSTTGVAFAVDATSFVLAAIVIAMIGRPGPGVRAAMASSATPGSEPAAAGQAEAHEPFLAAIAGGIRLRAGRPRFGGDDGDLARAQLRPQRPGPGRDAVAGRPALRGRARGARPAGGGLGPPAP